MSRPSGPLGSMPLTAISMTRVGFSAIIFSNGVLRIPPG